jgi:hypothetical protein
MSVPDTAVSAQNVTNAPDDNAPVLMCGVAATYSKKVSPQGLAFHPKAFTAAFVDLPVFGGQDICKRMSDPELGLSMRVWRQPDIQNDQCPTRVDILYGLACLRPEFACRVQG